MNDLGKQLAANKIADFHEGKEIEGHTPPEVVFGGLLGIFIATGLYFLKVRL
jgi:acid phosphatase family membrane protein YuiD